MPSGYQLNAAVQFLGQLGVLTGKANIEKDSPCLTKYLHKIAATATDKRECLPFARQYVDFVFQFLVSGDDEGGRLVRAGSW